MGELTIPLPRFTGIIQHRFTYFKNKMFKFDQKVKYNGPHDVGDPDDYSLRKLEKDVLVEQKLRKMAARDPDKCQPVDQEFLKCIDSHNPFLVRWYCNKEINALWDCMSKWYHNEEFRKEATDAYLQERREFRLTGVSSFMKEKDQEMSERRMRDALKRYGNTPEVREQLLKAAKTDAEREVLRKAGFKDDEGQIPYVNRYYHPFGGSK